MTDGGNRGVSELPAHLRPRAGPHPGHDDRPEHDSRPQAVAGGRRTRGSPGVRPRRTPARSLRRRRFAEPRRFAS